jgi:phenylacetate-CoA ligase
MDHCFGTVPYYTRLAEQYGVRSHDFKEFEDLKQLPVLHKATVQEHYPQLRSRIIPDKHCSIAHTSGTTGGGLRFAATREAIREQWAVWWRYRRWHGIDFDTWCGYFGGRSVVPLSQKNPPFWRYNLPSRQILFSGYHMNEKNLAFYVNLLRKKKPPWLHGYPSLLALLASYLMDKNDTIGYPVQWITVGAENLLPHQLTLIEKAFGVRPRQHYGMAEGVANFSECPLGSLHVDEDFAAVEFVPYEDGSGYKIIGTNFSNLATPLVRYDTGDIAEVLDGACSCGRPGRIVKRIDGRQEDYIVLKNGSKLGRMDHVFKDMLNIREAQLFQNIPGKLSVRIVKGPLYSMNDEERLYKELVKRVGNNMDIALAYVNELERSKTGKLRFVVSEIEEGKIA